MLTIVMLNNLQYRRFIEEREDGSPTVTPVNRIYSSSCTTKNRVSVPIKRSRQSLSRKLENKVVGKEKGQINDRSEKGKAIQKWLGLITHYRE